MKQVLIATSLLVLIIPASAAEDYCRPADRSRTICEIQVRQDGRYQVEAVAKHHTEDSRKGTAWVEIELDGRTCGERAVVSCDNCAPAPKATCRADLTAGYHKFTATTGNQYMASDGVTADLFEVNIDGVRQRPRN